MEVASLPVPEAPGPNLKGAFSFLRGNPLLPALLGKGKSWDKAAALYPWGRTRKPRD